MRFLGLQLLVLASLVYSFSGKDLIKKQKIKVGKKTCTCSFTFTVISDKIQPKQSKASCDRKCSGKSEPLTIRHPASGNIYSFVLKVKRGKGKLIDPKVEVCLVDRGALCRPHRSPCHSITQYQAVSPNHPDGARLSKTPTLLPLYVNTVSDMTIFLVIVFVCFCQAAIEPGRGEDGFFEGDMKLSGDQLESLKVAHPAPPPGYLVFRGQCWTPKAPWKGWRAVSLRAMLS